MSPDPNMEGIFTPEYCPRGCSDCKALAQIIAEDHLSFVCIGENDGTRRQIQQDCYTFCFKNDAIDELSHWDKRDLVHQLAVIGQALAVIEERESGA